MPRFFFDLSINGYGHHDAEGVEYTNAQTARTEAIVTLADLARDELTQRPSDTLVMRCEVRADDGSHVYAAELALEGMAAT